MKNGRFFNFSAGPSMLPDEVLERAGKEILNYEHSGMSVMEMSHRSKMFQQIFDHTKSQFKKLMHPISITVRIIQFMVQNGIIFLKQMVLFLSVTCLQISQAVLWIFQSMV